MSTIAPPQRVMADANDLVDVPYSINQSGTMFIRMVFPITTSGNAQVYTVPYAAPLSGLTRVVGTITVRHAGATGSSINAFNAASWPPASTISNFPEALVTVVVAQAASPGSLIGLGTSVYAGLATAAGTDTTTGKSAAFILTATPSSDSTTYGCDWSSIPASTWVSNLNQSGSLAVDVVVNLVPNHAMSFIASGKAVTACAVELVALFSFSPIN